MTCCPKNVCGVVSTGIINTGIVDTISDLGQVMMIHDGPLHWGPSASTSFLSISADADDELCGAVPI